MHMCFIVSGQKKMKKNACSKPNTVWLLWSKWLEKFMSLHLTQVEDHQFHLNIKDYLVNTSLVKLLLSNKRTGLVVHAKFVSWLNMKLSDWVMLQRNASGMDMRVVMNVLNVWWHYVLTLVLDFIISTRIILFSINLGREITDYIRIYMHGVN